jgi:hypothetical protein
MDREIVSERDVAFADTESNASAIACPNTSADTTRMR